MPTTAQTWLDWAESRGLPLTAEQIASIPAYQREIYAEEIEKHQRRHTAELAPACVIRALREAGAMLRPLGWRLLEVAANEATGFVRIVAECRDWAHHEGVQVLIQRSTFDASVLEERSRIVLQDGMFKHWWQVGEMLGRRRFDDIAEAAREMLRYACDNDARGALSLSDSQARQAALAPLMLALAD